MVCPCRYGGSDGRPVPEAHQRSPSPVRPLLEMTVYLPYAPRRGLA